MKEEIPQPAAVDRPSVLVELGPWGLSALPNTEKLRRGHVTRGLKPGGFGCGSAGDSWAVLTATAMSQGLPGAAPSHCYKRVTL